MLFCCIGAGTFGPISQNQFLHKLGVRERIEVHAGSAMPSNAITVTLIIGPDERGLPIKCQGPGEQLRDADKPGTHGGKVSILLHHLLPQTCTHAVLG